MNSNVHNEINIHNNQKTPKVPTVDQPETFESFDFQKVF